MQWNGFKIPIIILALIVGLGGLWGGHWLFNRYNYERPLTKLLDENKDIDYYQIEDQQTVMQLEVKLIKVDNLQESYNKLFDSIKYVVGRREFKLILKDDRDPTLENIYYHARLAAYESLKRGNFLEMESYISKLSTRQGSRSRITVDENYLFIQIEHDNHYLYEIIPRDKDVVSSGGLERMRPSD